MQFLFLKAEQLMKLIPSKVFWIISGERAIFTVNAYDQHFIYYSSDDKKLLKYIQ